MKLAANRAVLDYQVSPRTTLPGFSEGAEYYQKFQTLYNFCVTMRTKIDQSWLLIPRHEKIHLQKHLPSLIKGCIMGSVISKFP